MRILVFTEFDLALKNFNTQYINDENIFYELVLNKKFDVMIISFSYFKEFLEIKNFVKSTVIFLVEYCDNLIYKKALEVGDYCYLINEYEKLIIRLKYLQKKILNINSAIYKSDKILYNFNTNELYIDLKPVKISLAENELLKTLLKNKNRFLSKEDILMECDSIESETSIKVLISRLRKLGFKIENKKNLGYRIKG
jgi:DNA-binding response OmpR family regulator